MITPGNTGIPWVVMLPAAQWIADIVPLAEDVMDMDPAPPCAAAEVLATVQLLFAAQFAMPPSKSLAGEDRKSLPDVPDGRSPNTACTVLERVSVRNACRLRNTTRPEPSAYSCP